MPRKEPVRPLGAKPHSLGMKRKNVPGRYLETTEKIASLGTKSTDGKRCAWDNRLETVNGTERIMRCGYEATRFVRFAWWCAGHAPAIPDSCTHSHPSHLWGRLVCTWCGFDHGPIPEKINA